MADSTVVLVVFFFLLLLCASDAEEAFWWKCSDTKGNYTANSTYESNLSLVLSYLSSSTHPTGFSNVSLGSIPNRVQGLALCLGDVDPSACKTCVASAAYDAPQLCLFRKEATIWYSGCHIRYSHERFLSIMDSTIAQSYVNVKKVDASELERFNLSVATLLDSLTEYAVHNSTSPPLFAVGRMIYESKEYPRLYGLVQCTRDITAAECRECLRYVIGVSLRCCSEVIGKRFIARSCTFNSELDPRSYNWSVQLLYPPVKVTVPPSPSPLPSPSPSSTPDSGSTAIQASSGYRKRSTKILPVVLFLTGFAIILVVSITFLYLRQKRSKNKSVVAELHDMTSGNEPFLFEWSAIKQATDNFSPINKLGEGGYGSVYKGVLQDGREIAVKRPWRGSVQGNNQLTNEAMLLARLRHRNLVGLLGVCLDGDEKLLIYEFVTNGSLEDVLFDPIRKQQLNWERRKRIIAGIGRGLLYLHEESQVKIIHRDMKASNILLDGDMNPKIADFGTARLFDADQTHASTRVIVGTFGYMAPEYVTRGHVSEKLDVFSFGLLILEMVTGRRCTDLINSSTSTILLSFVWEHWSNDSLSQIIDPSLGDDFDEGEVRRCVQIGLSCVDELPESRPSMSSVILQLSGSSGTIRVPTRPDFVGGYSSIDGRSNEKPILLSFNELSVTDLDAR